ncbi:uncharacterized protein VP01_179g4 [Puccinia sorghi]|uniref:Uncharacterized protein n=1 Tax=Puccinia sorghi TaxID=27349 RepID=A0A0L6VEY1_9BASI|nr:uncharacterized protein VP01_179g4 [Puccinia sorghi]
MSKKDSHTPSPYDSPKISPSSSPSIQAQTGLLTQEQIRCQAEILNDAANLPFLTGNKEETRSKTSADKDKHLFPPTPFNPQVPMPTPETSSLTSLPSINKLSPSQPLSSAPSGPELNPYQYSPYPPYPFFPYPYMPPNWNPHHLHQANPLDATGSAKTTVTPQANVEQKAEHPGRLLLALEDTKLQCLADEDRKGTVAILSAAVKLIFPRDHLLPDGSNYCKWSRWLRELASQFIYNVEFFNKPNTNAHYEHIGCTMILHSVDASLEDELSILTFMKLLRLSPENYPTTASYAAGMQDVVANFKDLNLII